MKLRYVLFLVYGWRFCVTLRTRDKIPPLWVPPIAGISYEEAQAIFERHRAALTKLPGNPYVLFGREGITVFTEQPEHVPASVEGLPVKAEKGESFTGFGYEPFPSFHLDRE